jgi:hypothetical protein
MTCTLKNVAYCPDIELTEVWHELGSKQRIVFNDQDITSSENFIKLARARQVIMYLVYVGNERAAVTWLNGFEGYSARIHHCFFRPFYRESVSIARSVIEQLFQVKRLDGSPMVKTLIGLTPVSNRLAVRFARKVGMNVICEIPDACMVDGVSVAGLFTFLHFTEMLWEKEQQ